MCSSDLLGLALPRSGLELTGRESYDLVAQGSDRALFRYRDPSGRVQIDKEYRLRAGSHFFDLFVRIHNLGSQPLPELTTLNTSGRQDPKAGDPGLFTGPGNLQRGVCYVRQEVIRTAVREVPPTGQVEAGAVLWAGADQTSFLPAILPAAASDTTAWPVLSEGRESGNRAKPTCPWARGWFGAELAHPRRYLLLCFRCGSQAPDGAPSCPNCGQKFAEPGVNLASLQIGRAHV